MELGFLGFRVVLLEKRETFSRNNVLHLWPFAIHDLRGLGAKKFYGKFCAGAIDHISELARHWLPVVVVVVMVVVVWWCGGGALGRFRAAPSAACVSCLQVSGSCS